MGQDFNRLSLYHLVRRRQANSLRQALCAEMERRELVVTNSSYPYHLRTDSTKKFLAELQCTIKQVHHPFDNSPLNLCVVDVLSPERNFSAAHLSARHPGKNNQVNKLVCKSFENSKDFDIVVVHGFDLVSTSRNLSAEEFLRSVLPPESHHLWCETVFVLIRAFTSNWCAAQSQQAVSNLCLLEVSSHSTSNLFNFQTGPDWARI